LIHELRYNMVKLKCPECGSQNTSVEDTKNHSDKIIRYRQCDKGHKFKTYETYQDYASAIDKIEWQINQIRG